jgi:GntR family transcriptional regulator
MPIQLSGKQDVYIEVANRYKEYIELGIIKKGEKLPSVRTAACELGINPNTVAKAYSLLEEEGYLCSLPKKGVYVIYDEHCTKEKDAKNRRRKAAIRHRKIENAGIPGWECPRGDLVRTY